MIELELLVRAKEIKRFETHVTERLKAYGQPICDYKVDFKIFHNDGTIEFLETKGVATPDWKLKWKGCGYFGTTGRRPASGGTSGALRQLAFGARANRLPCKPVF